jgi:hypothetical protein
VEIIINWIDSVINLFTGELGKTIILCIFFKSRGEIHHSVIISCTMDKLPKYVKEIYWQRAIFLIYVVEGKLLCFCNCTRNGCYFCQFPLSTTTWNVVLLARYFQFEFVMQSNIIRIAWPGLNLSIFVSKSKLLDLLYNVP